MTQALRKLLTLKFIVACLAVGFLCAVWPPVGMFLSPFVAVRGALNALEA
jgi:hypothetical protein